MALETDLRGLWGESFTTLASGGSTSVPVRLVESLCFKAETEGRVQCLPLPGSSPVCLWGPAGLSEGGGSLSAAVALFLGQNSKLQTVGKWCETVPMRVN